VTPSRNGVAGLCDAVTYAVTRSSPPLLIGGVVVTESVFTIPGLGRLTVDAVLARDYPTIQAVILLFPMWKRPS
jgi:ABC-type dipeptide/oligopeptide/nickel transport system permease component